MVKCAFVHGMLISEQGVMGIDVILDVILSETKYSTEKFDFYIVEKFEQFRGKYPNLMIIVLGIMGLHSLKLLNEKIVLSEWTCNECTNYMSWLQHAKIGHKGCNFVNNDDDNGQTDISDTIQVT